MERRPKEEEEEATTTTTADTNTNANANTNVLCIPHKNGNRQFMILVYALWNEGRVHQDVIKYDSQIPLKLSKQNIMFRNYKKLLLLPLMDTTTPMKSTTTKKKKRKKKAMTSNNRNEIATTNSSIPSTTTNTITNVYFITRNPYTRILSLYFSKRYRIFKDTYKFPKGVIPQQPNKNGSFNKYVQYIHTLVTKYNITLCSINEHLCSQVQLCTPPTPSQSLPPTLLQSTSTSLLSSQEPPPPQEEKEDFPIQIKQIKLEEQSIWFPCFLQETRSNVSLLFGEQYKVASGGLSCYYSPTGNCSHMLTSLTTQQIIDYKQRRRSVSSSSTRSSTAATPDDDDDNDDTTNTTSKNSTETTTTTSSSTALYSFYKKGSVHSTGASKPSKLTEKYIKETARMVTELYYDDLILLNYPIWNGIDPISTY